jgi:hypothetical protein
MLTDLAIKETYQTAFDMLHKSAECTGQEAGGKNFANLQIAASSSGSAGELKMQGSKTIEITDKIPGPPRALPAPAAVPHKAKEAIPAVSQVSSTPELVGISVQGAKDTIRPEDSASNVQVSQPEDEVDWNEEETDSDVKKKVYLESVKPKTRPPNRSAPESEQGEMKSSGARGSGQAAPASEHTEVKSSGARGVGHSFTSTAEVTQEEIVQAHVSIGQKYGRTLLAS